MSFWAAAENVCHFAGFGFRKTYCVVSGTFAHVLGQERRARAGVKIRVGACGCVGVRVDEGGRKIDERVARE